MGARSPPIGHYVSASEASSGQEANRGERRHRSNLHRAIAGWNRGGLDEYLELYDNAVRLHGYSPEPMDKAAVLGFYFMIFGAFPGSQLLRRSAGRREPPPARRPR
jgi:hypothetical protein